jgi:hypothetical protein
MRSVFGAPKRGKCSTEEKNPALRTPQTNFIVDKAKKLVHFCYRSAGLSIKDAGTTANDRQETLHV